MGCILYLIMALLSNNNFFKSFCVPLFMDSLREKLGLECYPYIPLSDVGTDLISNVIEPFIGKDCFAVYDSKNSSIHSIIGKGFVRFNLESFSNGYFWISKDQYYARAEKILDLVEIPKLVALPNPTTEYVFVNQQICRDDTQTYRVLSHDPFYALANILTDISPRIIYYKESKPITNGLVRILSYFFTAKSFHT